MVDIASEATRSVTESSQYKAEGLSLDNQINVAQFIRSYLSDPSKAGELIPAMASVTNAAVSAQIDEYNTSILQREKLLENSSENSPVIRDLDNLLAAIRRTIIASLDSHISTLEIQRDAMRREEELANRRISTMPSQERSSSESPASRRSRRSCSSTCSTNRRRTNSTMPSPRATPGPSTQHTAAMPPSRPDR